MRQLDAESHHLIVLSPLMNGPETAKALQDLRVQLRLIDKSIRLIEKVERIRNKRLELLPERDFVLYCQASNKNRQRRFPPSPHDNPR
jgi:hypothetical protein